MLALTAQSFSAALTARLGELGQPVDSAQLQQLAARLATLDPGHPLVLRVAADRREFMRGMLALGLGVATGALGTAFSNDAKAAVTNEILPPGFQICRDTVLRRVYLMMLDNRPLYESEKIKGALVRNGKIGDVNTGFIKAETPLTEPAYWFAVEYYKWRYVNGDSSSIRDFNYLLTPFYNNVKSNPTMYNWSEGISMYFKTWVAKKQTGNPIETERFLLKAIFTAAGRSEAEVDEYRQRDLAGKEAKLKEVMADFERLGAEMNRKRESATTQRASAEKSRGDEAKALDKKIFVLEKRLQREKLSYDKEYDLTQELKQLKARQQALAQGGSGHPSQSATNTTSDEYTRLLIASWSVFFLTLNEFAKTKTKNENYWFVRNVLEEPLVIVSGIKVRGPPFYSNL